MHADNDKNPLHGLTLEHILTKLHAHYGWEELGYRIRINCFNFEPSIKSSLKFLRKTPWARTKVEDLYLYTRPDFAPEPNNGESPAPTPDIHEVEPPSDPQP
jgi:uncharacterized protein (DUF2132 family)